MSLEEIKAKVLQLTQGKKFDLKTQDYIFVRVLNKNGHHTVYEVEEKDIPIHIVPDELYEQYYHHSPVIKLTKLINDDVALQNKFFISGIRLGLDSKVCPHVFKYDQEGLIEWNGNLYHAVKYDDPGTSLHDWVTIDHETTALTGIEIYRLIKGGLESFVYLENNGYVLTQYDPKNIHAGVFTEDRFNFFRLMFKGHKDPKAPFNFFKTKHEFSPPESEPIDIYKSYEFSLGLIALWAILTSKQKGGEFLKNYHDPANAGDLQAKLKKGIDDLFEGKDDQESKKLTEDVFNSLLDYDIKRRKAPKEILALKYFEHYDQEDQKAFRAEIDDNEKERKKMDEEEKKNFDA